MASSAFESLRTSGTMQPHFLLRATTTIITAYLLLLFSGPGFSPVPVVGTGGAPPLIEPTWILNYFYSDTLDGTVRTSGRISDTISTSNYCSIRYSRCDFINLALTEKFRFVGWNNINCTGAPLFEFDGGDVSHYETPRTWEAFKVYDIVVS